ncbi:MAG: VIT domain-containing protein [Planctomycetaceae bacterium]
MDPASWLRSRMKWPKTGGGLAEMLCSSVASTWLVASVLVSAAGAQLVIVDSGFRRPPVTLPPVPPRSTEYRIRQVEMQVGVVEQVAKVQVSQVFQNTGSQTLEAIFAFPLPDEAAISGLTLLVDGKELAGKLLKKEEARRIYEEIVRARRDPALLEYLGQGLFQTSVFPIPPGAERKVEIRYTQLLKKDAGLIDLVLPLGTTKHSNKPVETLDVTIRIESRDQLKTVYSPTHPVEITRPDDQHAVVRLSLKNSYSPDDFRLLYGTVNGLVGMNLLGYRPVDSDEGYFLLLASPEIQGGAETKIERTLLFAFDKSGSMAGPKMTQAKEALRFLLARLQPTDLFNIVTYDSNIEAFRPELQRGDETTVKAALQFVEGLYPGGSTHIDGALSKSLQLLQDPNRPNYVIFMTDGLPTVGETNEQKIAANARQHNQVHARMYAFGVGFDVNGRLLDRLAADHRGRSVYVKPNENIEASVATLYGKIGAPVLTDLKLRLEVAGQTENIVSRTYPRQLTDLYQGEQLVYVGRYKANGPVKFELSGQQGSERRQFTGEGTFPARSTDDSYAFIEKLWATRRIGEIIDELDLRGQNQELVDELVQLSLKHGILTPYTSFLADEGVSVHDRAAFGRRAAEATREELGKVSGQAGVSQRALKGNLQRANAAPAGAAAAMGGRLAESESKKLSEARGRGAIVQDAEGRQTVTTNVRQISRKTFYRKQNVWQDAEVTEQELQQAQTIRQFSPEFFEVAASFDGQAGKYLAFSEPVVVKLGSQVYRVEPAAE